MIWKIPNITTYKLQGRDTPVPQSENRFEKVTEEVYQHVCRVLAKYSSVSRFRENSLAQFYVDSADAAVQIRKKPVGAVPSSPIAPLALELDVFVDYIRLARSFSKPPHLDEILAIYHSQIFQESRFIEDLSPLRGLIPEKYFEKKQTGSTVIVTP